MEDKNRYITTKEENAINEILGKGNRVIIRENKEEIIVEEWRIKVVSRRKKPRNDNN